jgi:hypothetical protein
MMQEINFSNERRVPVRSNYSVGDRVKLSSLGKVRCPRLADRIGTVVGYSVYVSSVVVLLDGNKRSSTIHGAYLETVEGRAVEPFIGQGVALATGSAEMIRSQT